MATFASQSNLVVNQIQERSSQASGTLQLTLDAIDATRTAISASVALLVANDISISVTGVDTTYVPATAVAPTVPAIPSLPAVPNLPSAPTSPTLPTQPSLPSLPSVPTSPTLPLAPTVPTPPTVPTLPTSGAIAISQADWDAAYLRAMGLQDRIAAKNLAEGANRALWRGHAEWDESLAVLAADATDKGDMEDSQNALASAWDQAKALREDAIAIAKLDVDLYGSESQTEIGTGKLEVDLYAAQSQTTIGAGRLEADIYGTESQSEIGLGKLDVDLYGTEAQSEIGLGRLEVDLYEAQSRTEIANFSSLAAETRQYYIQGWTLAVDNYQKQWATKTQSEIGRLGYERLELDKSVSPERVRAEYDLKKTEIAQKNAVGELVDLIQTYAQITTALISGSDVSLGSGVSMGITPTVYNPGEGDVVLYPV